MFTCNECSKEFGSQRALNAHQVAHKKGSRYSTERTRKRKLFFECINCGIKKEVKRSSNNKFCSSVCSGEHRRKQSNEQIENGAVLGFDVMRRYLLETKGSCEECGVSDAYNGKPITLQCDHIDGNSDNNSLDNLRLLCPNCHSQTETWCGRNKKNTSRRKYARQWRNRVLSSGGRARSLQD